MSESISPDLNRRYVIDTKKLDWTPSPSGTVWRKRVHQVGARESGQVTSVVRYDSNARFPSHYHPAGEEILVLDGVFSDEHGDWPAGTYLLNPEGFHHAPFSLAGCLLFVKLRQYPGQNRQHVVVDTKAMSWQVTTDPTVVEKPLYAQLGFSDTTTLQQWQPGTDFGAIDYPRGVEYFVLDGEFEDEAGRYCAGTWIRLPQGSSHQPRSSTGCTLYRKSGGFPYLAEE